VDVDARGPLADHEETDAARALHRHCVTRPDAAFLERTGDSLELAVRKALKERDPLE